MKLIFLFVFVSLSISLPVQPNSTIAEETDRPTLDWPGLPESVKAAILNRSDFQVLSKLSLVSKEDQRQTREYLDTMKSLTEEDRLSLFMEAAKTNNTSLFNLLLNGTTTEIPDPAVLMAACDSGATAITRHFFAENGKAKIPFYSKEALVKNCMKLASLNGHLSLVKALGFAERQNPRKLEKIAYKAMESGHAQMAIYLYSLAGKDPKKQRFFEFWVASCVGDTNAMDRLLSSRNPHLEIEDIQLSAFLDFYTEKFSPNPLHCAIKGGHFESAVFLTSLINLGMPLSVTKKTFDLAVESGNLKILDLLVRNSVGYNFKVDQESLVLAASSGNLQMLQRILSEASKTNLEFGSDAVVQAKEHASSMPVLEHLIDRFGQGISEDGFARSQTIKNKELFDYYLENADIPSFSTRFIRTACEQLIRANHTDSFKALLARIQDRMALNPNERLQDYLLHVASQHGRVDMITALLESENPPDISLNSYHVIRSTASNGHTKALALLVDKVHPETDISQVLDTAFMDASFKGHIETMRYIVSLHSRYPSFDPSALQNTALQKALEGDQVNAARYLLSLKPQFPGVNPAENDNYMIKFARKHGRDHIVDFLVSLPDDMGVDRAVATMDPSDVNLDLLNDAIDNL